MKCVNEISKSTHKQKDEKWEKKKLEKLEFNWNT